MHSSVPFWLLLLMLYSLPVGADSRGPQARGNFSEYCKQLPTLPLPLEFRCGYNGPKVDQTTIDPQLLASFAPRGMHFVGKLASSNTKIMPILYYVVGDLRYPFLYTFDSQGRAVDSLRLIRYFCHWEDQGHSRAFALLKPDLSIVIADTGVAFTLDADGHQAEGPDTVSILTQLYQINPEGYFLLQWDSTNSFVAPHVAEEP